MTAVAATEYDLKGSSINRHSKPPPPGKAAQPGKVKTRKDNDFTQPLRIKAWPKGRWRWRWHAHACTQPDLAERLTHQLNMDTAFLASKNIMDYSLLIGAQPPFIPRPRDTALISVRPHCGAALFRHR